LTKSSRLASSILTATGLVCLRTSTLPGHQHHSRVTIAGIADRDLKGTRTWFQRLRYAERVIAELFKTHGMRRGATMVIEAVPDDVDRLLRASAQLLGIHVVEDRDIDTTLSNLTKLAEDAIKAMGREGTLKRLQGAAELDPAGLTARLRG